MVVSMQMGLYQVALCVVFGILLSITVAALIYYYANRQVHTVPLWILVFMAAITSDLGMFIVRLGDVSLLDEWWFFPMQQSLKHFAGVSILALLEYYCGTTRGCRVFFWTALGAAMAHLAMDVWQWGDWHVQVVVMPWGEKFYQVASQGMHRIMDLAFALVLLVGVMSCVIFHWKQCQRQHVPLSTLSWIAMMFVAVYLGDLALRFTGLGALRFRWIFGLMVPGIVIWQWLKVELQVKALLKQEHHTAELLQKRNQEQEQVLRMVSHDLRSPLVNLSGFLKEIQQDPVMKGIAEDTRYCLDQMDRSIHRMGHLLESLGQVVKHGRRKVALIQVDLMQVCHDMVDMCRLQLQNAEAKVDIATLKPCLGDPEIIAEVLQNLLENAMKYRQPGRKLQIHIGQEAGAQNRIALVVTDNGRGMNPQLAERAFELYVRLDNSKDQRGDGLGLFLIRNLVRDMGGDIRIESTEGVGTRVIVELLELK